MNRFALQFVSSIVALSTAAATEAQDPLQAATNSAQSVWTLDWEQSHCTVSKGDPKRMQFSVWMTPGDPDPQIYLIGQPGVVPRNPGETMTVTLSPGGERYEAEVTVVSDDRPTIVRTPEGRNQPSRIEVLADPDTGEVHQTAISWEHVKGSIVVSYDRVPNISVPVPITMVEQYFSAAGDVISGYATYANYRTFQTSGRVLDP